MLELTPAEARLTMPVQSLTSHTPTPRVRLKTSGIRRIFLLLGTAAMTVAAVSVMTRLLSPGGVTLLEGVALSVYAVLFAWIAFAFVSAMAGAVLIWTAPRRTDAQPVISRRTALLVPTYNEHPGRVMGAVQAIREDLARLGVAELYDVFVLSDTQDPVAGAAELTAVLRLRAKLGRDAGVYYRRREKNIDRKAGNIADWVQRFGAAYEFFLILDADSVMTGDTLVRLTAQMESDDRTGLVQTLPTIIGATTLFGRLQQFAARVYAPVIAAGQDWWSGAEGNYWGHNAMIRTRAFADCAGLPHLPGKKPFGGHILSHDFVEAGLLRRGGWAVRMAWQLPGTFEESPPSLLDMAQRDRRWCQGNLQHAAVLGAKGFHWVSRLHLLRGILSYATAPLWLVSLVVGGAVWVETSAPRAVANAPAAWLLMATIGLLITPKFVGALLTIRDAQARASFGGGTKFVLSVLAETAISALMAPVMMLMQTQALVEILLGRDSGWSAQQRDNDLLTGTDAWEAHRGHVAAGFVGAVIAFVIDPALFLWTSPVTIGLLAASPLSRLTASRVHGQTARRANLFMTPEEGAAPQVAIRAHDLRIVYDNQAQARVLVDRMLRKGDVAMYRPSAIRVLTLGSRKGFAKTPQPTEATVPLRKSA